ncbi:MAG: hypothetical protein D6768_07140 [Chloroflexi bacterium]|nr:MAG: hypothetical protein D6768_07140 [Chloroflexota bacterium]
MLMSHAESLLRIVQARAETSPGGEAFTFVDQPCTWRELWQGITQFAADVHRLGLAPGDRAVLALPNSAEFFFAFYGVQRAGGIAVPVFPGMGAEHISALAVLCGAGWVVVPADTPAAQRAQLESVLDGARVVAVSPAAEPASLAGLPPVDPAAVAFIQYTSGSTGNPKGVQITHANLVTNVRQMIAGMKITANDVFVSWLPVFHDMGLILMTMAPFAVGARLILLPTSLRNIHHWFSAIQRHGGTFTAAPDFAYRYAVRAISNPADFNLSTLRVALNAAEPVRHQTITDFETTFGLSSVMSAAYGLAEATVGVSMWPPNTPPRVDSRGNVSVGVPFPQIEIEILQDGQPAARGAVGEIAVKSPANVSGYFNNPAATAGLFWRDGFILTGDLGYLDADGYLFIVGRKKNTIIHAGQTVYARELEEAADAVALVRRCAAIGVDRGGLEGEQALVFAEIYGDPPPSEPVLQEVLVEIVSNIHRRLGFRPGRVYLTKAGAIPMTHNGKLQHARLKERYTSGELFKRGQIIYPDF